MGNTGCLRSIAKMQWVWLALEEDHRWRKFVNANKAPWWDFLFYSNLVSEAHLRFFRTSRDCVFCRMHYWHSQWADKREGYKFTGCSCVLDRYCSDEIITKLWAWLERGCD